MINRRAAVLAPAVAALLLAAPPASSATTVADWRMEETAGSWMRGTTTSQPVGTIGSRVDLLGGVYRFPFIGRQVVDRSHLVTVPDRPVLNPGTSAWSVTTRLKFTHNFGNVLQKGQGGDGRTYFKMQAPRGIVSCLFRGSAGSVSVNSGMPLNDGAWHTVTCRRSGNEVTMTVDGKAPRRGTGPTGAISNALPFTIGGKSQCNGDTVTCDYWVGQLDFVRIATG